jgi:hypothetical protein
VARVEKLRQRVTEMEKTSGILYFYADELRHLLAVRVQVKDSMDTSLSIELTSWS